MFKSVKINKRSAAGRLTNATEGSDGLKPGRVKFSHSQNGKFYEPKTLSFAEPTCGFDKEPGSLLPKMGSFTFWNRGTFCSRVLLPQNINIFIKFLRHDVFSLALSKTQKAYS